MTEEERKAEEAKLRDHFAGQAIAGIAPCMTKDDEAAMAKRAYSLADAMIAERAKRRP